MQNPTKGHKKVTSGSTFGLVRLPSPAFCALSTPNPDFSPWTGVPPRPRHDPQTEATSYHRGASASADPTPSAGARPECPGRSGAVTGHTGFGHAPAPGIMAAV